MNSKVEFLEAATSTMALEICKVMTLNPTIKQNITGFILQLKCYADAAHDQGAHGPQGRSMQWTVHLHRSINHVDCAPESKAHSSRKHYNLGRFQTMLTILLTKNTIIVHVK
eukprot:6630248-Ditylum_brightwellii.AAC.1